MRGGAACVCGEPSAATMAQKWRETRGHIPDHIIVAFIHSFTSDASNRAGPTLSLHFKCHASRRCWVAGGERKVFVDVRVSARNPLLNGDKEEVASRQNFSTGQAEQEDGYAQNI